MADRAISELSAATSVTSTDLFVLEQNSTAKKLTGQILENWLVSFADGHGGIQSIELTSTSGLVDTYTITLADETTFAFTVTNAKSISSIAKYSTSGLVDTYRITYNDSTYTSFTVTNGEKGDTGDAWYLWIKYASQEPTSSSHDMGDVPDEWIGIYSGTESSAPTDYTEYTWYQYKGDKGDTGDPATLDSQEVVYQASSSGVIVPSGTWSTSIPTVSQGYYLWCRTTLTYNTGDPVISYSVSRYGIDGSGSVSSVAGVSPDTDGNVALTAEDIDALPLAGGTMLGTIDMGGQPVTGLNDPTDDTDAARKGYVDNQISTVNDAVTNAQTTADNAQTTADNAASAASTNANLLADIVGEGAGPHNAIYRGKYLGTAVTDEQYAEISAGTFNDLYIGDYWTINGTTYRIAAFDYYYQQGDTSCTTHHATLVPDKAMYSAAMNSSATTTGAYIGSEMYTTNLEDARTTISTDFSGHVLTHRQHFQNAVTSGYPSGGTWYDSYVDLMNEQNVYGCKIFTSVGTGTTTPNNYTIDKSQFPLFRFRPDMIANQRGGYWLRDVVTAAAFALVTNSGFACYYSASLSYGVRPAFSIS